MAVIAPQTDVYLLKVPLEINDLNQLTFTNATAQYNYFSSLPKLEVHDFTYQRKDGTIRYGGEFDELLTYNYVMYRNDAFSNKWFYAFITGMEWKSPNCTDISIKTDVWQTWQFSLTFKPVLIDREHTNNDTVGSNTLPEGLELGEMVTNGNVVNFAGVPTSGTYPYYVIAEVSQVENHGTEGTLSYSWISGDHSLTPRLNSIDRGTIPLVIGFPGGHSGVVSTINRLTHLYDVAGLSDSVVNVYVLPSTLVGGYNEIELTATPNTGSAVTVDGLGVPIDHNGTTDIATTTFTKPTSVDGYTPKNKKLLTYPYCYFNISNNAGTSIPYHYEDFSGNITFKTEGTFGLSGSTKTIPQNYKNISSSENGMDYSITGPKYPVCSWKSDSYTNWLTQNAVNLNTQWKHTITSGLLGAGLGAYENASGVSSLPNVPVSSVLKLGAVGAGMGLATMGGNLINLAREQHLAKTQANMVSDQVHGNLNAGDFLWAKYQSAFTYLPMSIKAEYARCIDEYWSQFGYKCNRVKVPNITGRRNWNYVKTVGCYITGDVPQSDMQEIKDMFDRGITLWHNPATFADYSQNNDII